MLLRRLTLLVAVGVSLSVAVGCGAGPDEGGALAREAAGEESGPPSEEGLWSEGDVGDESADGIVVDEAEIDDADLRLAGDAPLAAADDALAVDLAQIPIEQLAASTLLRATANVNLRKGPGTTYGVLKVIPKGATVTRLAGPTNGWLQVRFSGTDGWSSASYLGAVTSSGGSSSAVNLDGPASPANAIARAQKAMGFSYWWGGGAWRASGVTASTRGTCSGACPSCSHSGAYGADCSGMVAKAWQFGVKALETNSHPYSTVSFNRDVAGKWRTVSRDALKQGDALVYNSGGSGHVVLYEKGSGWGTPTVYECKGCKYGCVHNARSFSSSYHGIRRAGF